MRNGQLTNNGADKHLRAALVRMFELKLRNGSTAGQVNTFLQDCLNEARLLHLENQHAAPLNIYSLAAVQRSWHTETHFLKADGSPKPLAFEGPHSLKKLIAMHFPKEKPEVVLEVLRNNKLIKRYGNRAWLPTERHARVPKATKELLDHLAEGMGRLAETVSRNTRTTNKEDLLFERASKVFHLPVTEAKAFREHLQKQGVAFILAVDDWLETRAVRSTSRRVRTCAAGAFAFAFIDDEQFRRKSVRSRKRRKQ